MLIAFALALGVRGTADAMAQAFSLSGLEGGSLSETDLGKGNTVVVLWASWSPRGRNVAERVNSLAQQTGKRATVVAVNYQEDRATAKQFVASSPFSVPVYLDAEGALAKKFKLASLPGLLVIKNGAVAYQGRLPDDLQKVVDDALN
ncbi:MAG: TlpA disulfide reductase family protein [Acidobacteriota bacterium]